MLKLTLLLTTLILVTLGQPLKRLPNYKNKLTVIDRIKRLSPSQTTDLTICIRVLPYNKSEIVSNRKCLEFYQNVTGEEYNMTKAFTYSQELEKLQRNHITHKSFFSKMLGLMSFANLLAALAALVGFALLISVMGNLLLFFAAYIASFFYQLLLSRYSFYTYASALSFLTIYYRYDIDIVNTSWSSFYLLDHYSVVFGCFVFSGLVYDIVTNIKDLKTIRPFIFLLSVFYAGVAIYHDHWFVATLSIWLLYGAFGFIIGAMPNGYYTGFNHKNSLQQSAMLSVFIVSFFVLLKTGAIQTNFQDKVELFENGCLFFGQFIGLLCLLIMSDKWYCYHHLGESMYYPMQFLMLAACLLTLFFGNVLSLTVMKSVSGTYLVLWLLDMEVHFLSQFKTGSAMGILAVALVNILALRYYIMNYRDYFII